jgi:hypothetical protein
MVMPSSGWMRMMSWLGVTCALAEPKRWSGASLNWMAISVTRFVSRLPERT